MNSIGTEWKNKKKEERKINKPKLGDIFSLPRVPMSARAHDIQA